MSDRELKYLNFHNDFLFLNFNKCMSKECNLESTHIIAGSYDNKNSLYRTNHHDGFHFSSYCLGCIDSMSMKKNQYKFRKIYTKEDFRIMFLKDIKEFI